YRFPYESRSATRLASLGSSRPRVRCGVCVNTLGFGHGAGDRKDWRDLWHRSPAPGSGGGGCAKVHLPPDPRGIPVEAFLVSSAVVGLAEIGDKTQILSLMLAARFQRPVPIILGILFATLANHAAAGLAGTLFGSVLSGPWMRCMVEPLRHRQTKGAETDMPGL